MLATLPWNISMKPGKTKTGGRARSDGDGGMLATNDQTNAMRGIRRQTHRDGDSPHGDKFLAGVFLHNFRIYRAHSRISLQPADQEREQSPLHSAAPATNLQLAARQPEPAAIQLQRNDSNSASIPPSRALSCEFRTKRSVIIAFSQYIIGITCDHRVQAR